MAEELTGCVDEGNDDVDDDDEAAVVTGGGGGCWGAGASSDDGRFTPLLSLSCSRSFTF
jgi:hypothetical protein